jgi:asparagine synthase (glutamine-hydrolysing)
MSDVPLGTFFSGGLDSSIIVYHLKDHKDIIHYAARKTIEDLKKEGSTSDYYYAEKFAREYSLNLIPIDIGNEELNIELIKKTIYYSDDLIADGSQIPSFLITLEASKRTKVLLSGMGADELFLGYAGHQLTLMASYFDNLPGFLKSILGSILGNLKAGQGLLKAYKRYLQKFGRYYNNPLRYGFYNIVGDLENSLSVYSSPNIDPLKLFKKYFQNDNDPFDNIFDFELNNFLIKNLHYIDRMCMANSVEGRIPFLDYRLVEFAYSLPRSYKLSQTGKSKRILKDMASAYLPEYIIKRRKAGFGMPLRSILSNEEKINSLIDFEMLNEIKNFSVDSIRRIIKNHINGTEDNSALIYSIISFQLWYKEFSSQ